MAQLSLLIDDTPELATTAPDQHQPIPYDPALVERAINCSALAVDIETATTNELSSLDEYGLSYLAPITFVSLAFRPSPDEPIQAIVFNTFDDQVQDYLRRIMARELATIFHNSVFDTRNLSKFSDGVVPRYIWDTMVMAKLIHPELQDTYGLLDVATALGLTYDSDMADMKKQRDKLDELSAERVANYAAKDAVLTLQIYEAQCAQMGVIRDNDFPHYQRLIELNDWEVRAMRCYCAMAAVGVRMDEPHVRERIASLRQTAQDLKDTLAIDGLQDLNSRVKRASYIYALKGITVPDWEPASPFYTDKAHKLIASATGSRNNPTTIEVVITPKDFKGMNVAIENIPNAAIRDMLTGSTNEVVIKRQRVGDGKKLEPKVVRLELAQLSTSGEVLTILCGHNDEGEPLYPELLAMSDFLAIDYILTTLESLQEHASLDGRLHSLIAPQTQTGRRKSSHPQMQNWKMKASKGSVAGDMCGVAIGDTPEHTLVELDYSNAENWIAAMLSGDDNLAAACSAEDFHSAMAQQYFGEQWERADAEGRKTLRRLSKTITFGTAYGMGAFLLSVRNKISIDEAKDLLAAKERAFPYVATAKQLAAQAVKERGFVTLWTGRRVIGKADYAGWNYLCQGGVGEMIKRSIVLISEEYERRKMKSRVALDMHDALIISVHRSEVDTALNIASYIMEHVIPDEMNQRTTPAIHWIAQPDLEENAHKWGARQPMPVVSGETIDDPIQNGGNGAIGTLGETVAREVVQNVTYTIPDLNFSYFIDFPLHKNSVDMTSDELHKVLAWLEAVDRALYDALMNKYTTRIPLDENNALNYGNDGRAVIVSNELQVNVDTWMSAPLMWATVAQYHDTTELIGLDVNDLRAEYERRKRWRESLDERHAITSQKYSNVLRLLSKRVDDEFRAKPQGENQHGA